MIILDHTSIRLYDQATGLLDLLVIAQIDSFSDAARWTRRSSQRVPLEVGDVVVQVVHYQAAIPMIQMAIGPRENAALWILGYRGVPYSRHLVLWQKMWVCSSQNAQNNIQDSFEPRNHEWHLCCSTVS